MDREQILEQLLKLVTETDAPDPLRPAGDYAGVSPETKREVVQLWGDALEHNTWLIPEKVLEFTFADFRSWVQLSAAHFALGYILASREHLENEAKSQHQVPAVMN